MEYRRRWDWLSSIFVCLFLSCHVSDRSYDHISVGHFHGQPRMHDLLVALQVREGLECFAARLASLRLAALVFPVVLQVTLVHKRSTALAIDAVLQALFAFDAVYGCGHKVATTVFHFVRCAMCVGGGWRGSQMPQDIQTERGETRTWLFFFNLVFHLVVRINFVLSSVSSVTFHPKIT